MTDTPKRPPLYPHEQEVEATGELDESLRARGLERRDFTIPGYQGDQIRVSVIQRSGRTGTAACFYSIHGGGMILGNYLGNLDSFDDWLFTHDMMCTSQ